MSVRFYDRAVVEDLQRIFQDSKIRIYPPEQDLFTLIPQQNNDNIILPAISVSRPNWTLTENSSHPMRFDGATVRIDKNSHRVTRLQAISIRINYVFDIWTTTRGQNDDIMRELIFYYVLHPTLKVGIPYKLEHYYHNFNLWYEPDVEDNSDIAQHYQNGRYYRQSISCYTDDAYLWKTYDRAPTVADPSEIKLIIDGEDV